MPMHKTFELACSYMDLEFYWSSLLIGQFTSESLESYYIIIRSLHGLKFYKKIQNLIERSPHLLSYYEINIIYVKSGFETTIEPTISILDQSAAGLPASCTKTASTSNLPHDNTHSEPSKNSSGDAIKRKSLELFYKAKFKRSNLRKKYFIDSFTADTCNIESLIYLYKESLCMRYELLFYISQIPIEEIRDIMNALINNNFDMDCIYCPLLLFSYSLNIIHGSEKNLSFSLANIFRISTKMSGQFSSCEFIYSSLGLYYIYKGKYKEALRCFHKSIEINEEYGVGYLYLGVAYSFLKETEPSIRALDISSSIMDSSYLPSYYLAYEYQLMNNLSKAKYHYKNCLELIETELDGNFENDTNYLVRSKIRRPSHDVSMDNFVINDSTSFLSEHDASTDSSKIGTSEYMKNCDLVLNLRNNVKRDNAILRDSKSKNVKKEAVFDNKFDQSLSKKIKLSSEKTSCVLIKENSQANRLICGYVYCLLYHEEYVEAQRLLETYQPDNFLGVFYFLFNGMLDDSKRMLEKCKNNSLYHAVKGYLHHLVDEFDLSIKEYETSLSLAKNQVVENLISMAIENLAGTKPNKAFDYSNSLFETLEYKSRTLFCK